MESLAHLIFLIMLLCYKSWVIWSF